MDIKQLKRFLDLCETQSFTQTAKNLFLSQQALSSSVNSLEEELGKPLFRRTPRGVILTDEGAYLRQVCAPVVQRFDGMVLELERYFHAPSETLVFGLAPGVLQASSADLIFKFRTAYPNCAVKGIENSDTTCLEYVLEQRVELAFCSRPPDNPAIEYLPVGKEPLYAVLNLSSPLAQKSEISLRELKNEKFISLNKYHQIHQIILRLCGQSEFTPEFIVETGEISTLLGLAKLNEYVFICMRHIAEEIDKSACAAVPLSDNNAVWEYGFIYRKEDKLSRCAQNFISFIMEHSKN